MQPQTASNGPTSVGDNDFASRFGWYVDQINAKMANSWYKSDVDQRTPRGAARVPGFTIHKDGTLPTYNLTARAEARLWTALANAACSELTPSALFPRPIIKTR